MIANNLQYTPFNKVSSITDGDYTFAFQYNSNHERVKMEVENKNETVMTKYYFGPSEIQETSKGTLTINHIGIGTGLLAMHVTHPNGSTEIVQCFTDRLGSPIVLANRNGHEIGRYSYTPWGKQRDPYSLQTISFSNQPVSWFHRGYTGHEMLYGIGIINMNGRIYDPHTHQFLSPDNYIQAPGFSQSFNRFAYCVNNPLVYTDPSGDFIWTVVTGVVDFVATAFFKGGLDPTSKSARQNAWRDYDPTAAWSNTNKAWKIDMGLFKTDPNKSFLGRSWELISRFTWQAPQTALGYTGTGIHNLLGGVRSVDYYGGATVVESYSKNWGAIALGSYINGSRGITADPNDRLFQHEYGHYIQSQTSGWFYLSKYGIPSALSKNGTDHSLHPAEQDANIRAFKYFNKHIDGYTGWAFTGRNNNPINGYDSSLPYDNVANQEARCGRLRLEWFDYLLGPQIIIPGLINALVLNNRY